MQYSRDRIMTSHAGSLPRPDTLIAANQARQAGNEAGGLDPPHRLNGAACVRRSRRCI